VASWQLAGRQRGESRSERAVASRRRAAAGARRGCEASLGPSEPWSRGCWSERLRGEAARRASVRATRVPRGGWPGQVRGEAARRGSVRASRAPRGGWPGGSEASLGPSEPRPSLTAAAAPTLCPSRIPLGGGAERCDASLGPSERAVSATSRGWPHVTARPAPRVAPVATLGVSRFVSADRGGCCESVRDRRFFSSDAFLSGQPRERRWCRSDRAAAIVARIVRSRDMRGETFTDGRTRSRGSIAAQGRNQSAENRRAMRGR
jgi:hypothetical protein